MDRGRELWLVQVAKATEGLPAREISMVRWYGSCSLAPSVIAEKAGHCAHEDVSM